MIDGNVDIRKDKEKGAGNGEFPNHKQQIC